MVKNDVTYERKSGREGEKPIAVPKPY